MLTVLDTFAGAGGFSLGFSLAGCRVTGAIEIDQWAAETFRHNHKGAEVLCGDIALLSDQALTRAFGGDKKPQILLGGPPCQGFSVSNNKRGDPTDPRNSLFREFLRLGRLFEPRFLVLENVPDLEKALTSSGTPVTHIIRAELERMGYHVYHTVLQAADYNVPQIRRRLFVLASREPLANPFPAPETACAGTRAVPWYDAHLRIGPSLWDAISDLPDLEAGEGVSAADYDKEPTNAYQKLMRHGSSKLHNHVAMKHTKRIVARFAAMAWGDSVSDVPEHLRPYKRNSNGEIADKVYDQNNRRMHPNKPCHTIPASFYANFVHPYKQRNFTPREGRRIQSFPDSFVFMGKPTVVSHKLLQREGRHSEKYLCQYSQIGNAVPPLMAQALAQNLLMQINGSTRKNEMPVMPKAGARRSRLMSKQKPSSAAKREDLLAGLDLGNAFPHGSNIYQKLRDPDVRSNETKWALIQEISLRYTEWRSRSSSLSGDSIPDFVRDATLLYQDYRDYLDDPRMDIFDSRGALQPSALEEFCYYLFRPLLAGYGSSIAVGHYEVYQGLYFTTENFAAFASIPRPQFPVGNLDFVIGKRIEIDLKTDKGNTSNAIYVPAVAVECKTYLDRPRYIESEILAANIKRGFPRCLYIVISEFLRGTNKMKSIRSDSK